MSSKRRVRGWLAGVGGLLVLSGASPVQAQFCETCDDENVCTDDVCVSGVCRSTNNTAPCDDGSACTTDDTCSSGVCVGGAAPNCDDGNLCTDDACASATGCVHADNTVSCDDGSACTMNDACAAGACAGGAAPNCDDANVCTDDGCNPATGCEHAFNTVPCDDGDPLTTNDACSSGVCVGEPPSNCDDGDDCTYDVADEFDNCSHIVRDGPCEDGLACTVGDRCVGGGCVSGGAVTCCPSGESCTAGGVCAASEPAPNEPYRCLRFVWQVDGPDERAVGDIVHASLHIVTDGCNTPSTECGATGHPVAEVSAILNWDPGVLELQMPSLGNPNPADPCDNADCQFACPANEYNWQDSVFPNDCGTGYDSVNFPCTGFPANDGDALYVARAFTTCGGGTLRSACATPSGLHVTTFRFRIVGVPPAGVTRVSLRPCAGRATRTKAKSALPAPSGYPTRDATNTLGPPAKIRLRSCAVAADCDDFLASTVDSCVAGYCAHSGVSCDDGVDCTVDVLDEGTGACRHDPANSLCDPAGSFCAAQVCVPPACPGGTCSPAMSGCLFVLDCLSGQSNPCPNPATCDEATDSCGGCNAPTVAGAGSRYLNVIPAPQGSSEIALRVIGECGEDQSACVARYVQSKCSGGPNNGLDCYTGADCPKRCVGGLNSDADCTIDSDCPIGSCAGRCDAGTLGAMPFYKTAAQWGTANVRGAQIRPGTTYRVHAECNFAGGPLLSRAAIGTTWRWGDIDHDGDVDAIDVTNLVTAFKGSTGPFTFEQLNLFGCEPDDSINALDITLAVDAVKELPFPCAPVCP